MSPETGRVQVPARAPLWPLILTGIWGVVILALTLTPSTPAAPLSPFCVICGDLGGTDFVLNVALFLPLGIGVGAMWPGRWWRWVVPALLSLSIELVQHGFVPGRDGTFGDLLANSLGGGLGIAITAFALLLLVPNGRQARRLAAVSGALVLLALWGAGRMLTPTLPFLVYWVQWLPQKGGYATFPGSLDSLEVNGVPLRASEEVDPVFRPGILTPDRNEVRAVVRPVPSATNKIELIARLAAPGTERFMIGRHGDDFVYRVWLHAADLGFRVPIAALPDAFSQTHGSRGSDTSAIELESGIDAQGLRLRARGPFGDVSRLVKLSPGVAWALIVPLDISLSRGFEWLNALFLAMLVVPTMYWLAMSAVPRKTKRDTVQARLKALVMLGAFLVGMAGVHLLGGGAAFSIIEWLGVATGGVLGWSAARLVHGPGAIPVVSLARPQSVP